ncbi:hypothetical protein Tco_1395763 [Tanacetum coccineum]
MAMRVLPAMSPGLSASMAEVEAMSDSEFLEEEEDDEEEDDEEEDEESLDSDSVSVDAEDKGLTAEDEDLAAGDEGLATGDEGLDIGVESLSLGRDEAVPEGQQRETPVVEIAVGEPLGLGYRALRRREIALGEGRMPSVFEPTLTTWIDPEDGITYIDVPAYPPPAPPAQTPPSPEWSSASPTTVETEGFMTELGARVEMQEGFIRDHTIRLEELSPALFEMYDRDIGELFTMPGAVIDEIFSQRYRFRSLE